jgi:hypothetical protein
VRAIPALLLLLAPFLSTSAETQSWRLVDAVRAGARVRSHPAGAVVIAWKRRDNDIRCDDYF